MCYISGSIHFWLHTLFSSQLEEVLNNPTNPYISPYSQQINFNTPVTATAINCSNIRWKWWKKKCPHIILVILYSTAIWGYRLDYYGLLSWIATLWYLPCMWSNNIVIRWTLPVSYLIGHVPALEVPTYRGGPFSSRRGVQVKQTLSIPKGNTLHV